MKSACRAGAFLTQNKPKNKKIARFDFGSCDFSLYLSFFKKQKACKRPAFWGFFTKRFFATYKIYTIFKKYLANLNNLHYNILCLFIRWFFSAEVNKAENERCKTRYYEYENASIYFEKNSFGFPYRLDSYNDNFLRYARHTGRTFSLRKGDKRVGSSGA